VRPETLKLLEENRKDTNIGRNYQELPNVIAAN
jgi:hypothetical protein